jgi:hypothetical protein
MRDEFTRWNEALLRMMPADQGFASDQTARRSLDLGLIVKLELVRGDRAAQLPNSAGIGRYEPRISMSRFRVPA